MTAIANDARLCFRAVGFPRLFIIDGQRRFNLFRIRQ